MTMSREAKTDHRIQLDTAKYSPTGRTGTTHASPSRRGEYMTPAEYRASYMGRKQQVEPQARKLGRQGFKIRESGRAVKITRK